MHRMTLPVMVSSWYSVYVWTIWIHVFELGFNGQQSIFAGEGRRSEKVQRYAALECKMDKLAWFELFCLGICNKCNCWKWAWYMVLQSKVQLEPCCSIYSVPWWLKSEGWRTYKDGIAVTNSQVFSLNKKLVLRRLQNYCFVNDDSMFVIFGLVRCAKKCLYSISAQCD